MTISEKISIILHKVRYFCSFFTKHKQPVIAFTTRRSRYTPHKHNCLEIGKLSLLLIANTYIPTGQTDQKQGRKHVL
jgi:hypothetical protein